MQGVDDEELSGPVLGDLLGLLVHDLRNPLSAIRSNLSFVREALGTAQGGEFRAALEDVDVAAADVDLLVQNLSVLSRALRGRPVEPAATTLGQLLRHVSQACRGHAEVHGTAVDWPEELLTSTVRLAGDADLLHAALCNLVMNGVAHGAGRGGVEVRAELRAHDVLVTVTDSGPWVGEQHREALFRADRQSRARATAAQRYGRGFGLFAARLAAELAGGSVRCTESPERRNVFELVLARTTQ